MAKTFDCLGLGIAPADVLMQVGKYPKPGDKIDAENLIIQGGGPVPTAMVTMTRLGMKPAMMAAVGDDIFGRFVADELRREGVDTSLIKIKKQTTTVATGWVESKSGQRTIVVNIEVRIKPNDIKPASLPRFRSVHLDGRDLDASMKLAQYAVKKNIPVILDVGSMRNDVSALFPYISHLVCSSDFALPYTTKRNPETIVKALKSKCSGAVVVTFGTDGSTGLSDNSGLVRQKAFRVKTVDTTGAGDVYHGAYIAGLLKNLDLKKRMEMASAAAALKCTKSGGRTGIPSMRQLKAFLNSGVRTYA